MLVYLLWLVKRVRCKNDNGKLSDQRGANDGKDERSDEA